MFAKKRNYNSNNNNIWTDMKSDLLNALQMLVRCSPHEHFTDYLQKVKTHIYINFGVHLVVVLVPVGKAVTLVGVWTIGKRGRGDRVVHYIKH